MRKLYSARIILSALRRGGFDIVSQKGSHIKLKRTKNAKALIAIVPNHKEVARGTLESILKQADLTKTEFEKLVK